MIRHAILTALLLLLVGAPVALADDPTCTQQFPSPGPGGVDLRGACITNQVVSNYTSSDPLGGDRLTMFAVAIGLGVGTGAVVWVAWRFAASRAGRRLAPVQPSAWWVCPTCGSFNPADRATCYSCHRASDAEARLVETGEQPP